MKATLDELKAIPGIGEKTAARIIRERKNAGEKEITEKFPVLKEYVS